MKTTAPTSYRPGHFTEPVYQPSMAFPEGFPPNFTPLPTFQDLRGGPSASQRSSASRELQFNTGTGWGAGTIAELKGSGFDRPGWMAKS